LHNALAGNIDLINNPWGGHGERPVKQAIPEASLASLGVLEFLEEGTSINYNLQFEVDQFSPVRME